MDGDFTYKSQDVNYLGFLEAQLRDLHGIATLAYELIQNADDARDEHGRPQTTWLTFDVADDALVVENDGVFRPLDFQRLQDIASGGKRDEAGTTGAFGLGFIAVYHVTDAPEIFSGGLHWTIRPDAPPDRRIQQRVAATEGTRFRLPWAFDASSLVRRTLRIAAVRPDQLDDFAARIGDALELSALFLKQLQSLEVRRNGRLSRRIEKRLAAPDRMVLQDAAGRSADWLLHEGDFAAAAGRLRAQYPWQIEASRRSDVRLAIPVAGLDQPGRLFAVLPTDSTTPLPFHVNADFFPTTDRKRIHFDAGYQSEWNEAAVHCAAAILAQNFPALPPQLGPTRFWHLLQKVADSQQMAAQGELPEAFAAFWPAVAPALPATPILYTSEGEWRFPANVRLLARPTAVPLLEALAIPVAHPDLAPYFPLMRRPEIAAADLTIQDIAAALVRLGLTGPTPLSHAPSLWQSLDAWQGLWELIGALLSRLPRPSEREAALSALGRCALVLTDAMTLVPLDRVYRGQPEARALFPDLAWLHESIPTDSFPGRAVPDFGVRQAVELLASTPQDQLEAAWSVGRLDLPRLFRWFESRQIEIFADDPSLPKEIRRLPLCPVAGELRPLADLYIPGGFEDPLKLAGVIDLAEIGGRRHFLRDLGVRELDFDTYLQTTLPRVLAQRPDLPSDARHNLVRLLAERLGEFRDDEALQEQLSRLPLVACMDGSFRAANVVYASREALELLGDRAHIAEPVPGRAVQALHQWLGVRDEPSAAHVVHSLLALSQEWATNDAPLDPAAQARVRRCWQRLDTLLVQQQITADLLAPLQSRQVIPNQRHVLLLPAHLVLADQADLAARFVGLADNLLSPDEGYSRAAAAVGVRPLSQAAQLEVVNPAAATADLPAQERLAERRPLVVRLLRAEGGNAGVPRPAEFLAGLRVLKIPHLQVHYRLQIGDRVLTTPPEPAAARLLPAAATLYLSGDPDQLPWPAVARELALALVPHRPPGSLAIAVKEILAAVTFAEADQILVELGYH